MKSYEIAGAVALPSLGRGRLPRMNITRKRLVLTFATIAATLVLAYAALAAWALSFGPSIDLPW